MRAIILSLALSIAGITCLPYDSYGAEKVVYVTPKGKKYHIKNCKTLAKSKKVQEITITNATKRGYTACKVCRPN